MIAQFDDDDDFQSLTVGELIDLLKKMAGGDWANAGASKRAHIVAQRAEDEFRRRFERRVILIAQSTHSRLFPHSVRPEDIVGDVFAAVSERAHSFTHNPADSERDEHRRICAWLGPSICHNLIKRLTDKELLLCAARRDVGDYEWDVAEKAFTRFDDRHRKLLRKRCTQFTWGLYSEMEVDELVQDTLFRAWSKAHTYDDKGITDQDNLFWLTAGWLNEIALNLFIDSLRRRKDVEIVACEDEEALDKSNWLTVWQQFFSSGCQDDDSAASELRAEEMEERAVEFAKEAVLTVLTDIERVVYQIDMQDYADEAAKREAFKALEASYNITPNCRRQHLFRAKNKVQKHLRTRMEEYLRGLDAQAPPRPE